MVNLSKIKRDNMIAFLEELKKTHSDDASIRAFNEIENHLREKKYGLVWEEHSEAVDEMLAENIPVLTADSERRLCKDESLPWNFIIEGDNLQALYLLEKTHRGKVDCIYIDPPYNTGAKDWKYNNDYVGKEDEYRHSKWLSMMKNRLLLARHLLNPEDSVLIVTIDEKEYLRLGCLLEELFPTATIQMITAMTNKKGSTRPGQFSRAGEYLYCVYVGKCAITQTNDNMMLPLDNEESKETDETQSITIWNSLLRRGTAALRTDRPNLFYPIYIDTQTKKIVHIGDSLNIDEPRESAVRPSNIPETAIACWPMRKNDVEGRWQVGQTTLKKRIEEHRVKAGQFNKTTQQFSVVMLKDKQMEQIEDGILEIIGTDETGAYIVEQSATVQSSTQSPRTIWVRDSHDASVYGSTLLRSILVNRKFPFPKSLYAVQDTIRFFIANKPEAVVVDFFAGSGTTMHAVNLLNAEDGGQRTCIMVTNNEISAEEEKDFQKRGIEKCSEEWQSRGIARYVTWPRTVCSINGIDVNGKALKGEYLGSDIPMATGFKANVKYFKCDWTPRKPEDYLLSNVLCLHIREMIELQNAIEIDNVKNVLILNKTDFKNIILNPEIYAQIQNIWVNQNIVLNSEELKLLEAKGFKYIPREFFGQELREAAE